MEKLLILFVTRINLYLNRKPENSNRNSIITMYETNDFKKGLKILIKNEPYVILDFQHVKPGKGNQFTRTKLKNLLSGSNQDMTFRSGEKFSVPDIAYRSLVYLYKDNFGFHFMDQENYESLLIDKSVVSENAGYLTENREVTACFFNSRVIYIELPKSLILTVKETEPGLKGNTVSNTTKPAIMETGLVIQVPLHINEGDKLKINTSDRTYIERITG